MVGIVELFLVALGAASPARPAQVINVSVPVSGVLINACNGEEVAFSGALHLRKRTTRDDHHISITENGQHLSGVGLVTGAAYRVPVYLHQRVNITGDVSDVILVEHVNVVGQGDVPNFTTIIREHFTINANGDIIDISNDVETFCR